MTQLFIGHKPGVGPVVKVLKHDGDDPLTLANDAYDRYFFNSENQRLTQIVSSFAYTRWYADDFPAAGTYHFGGDAASAKMTMAVVKNAGFTGLDVVFRLDNFYPDRPYLPICEFRQAAENGEIWVARSTKGQWSGGGNINRGYTFQMAFCVLAKVQGYTSNTYPWAGQPNWSRLAHTSLAPYVAVGDYTILGGLLEANLTGEARGYLGVGIYFDAYAGSAPKPIYNVFHVWNLPADDTPLPTYVTAPGLETVRISAEKVAIARPGFDVSAANGPNEFILDSDGDSSQAICIAAGTVEIAATSNVVIPNPTIIPLTDATIVDMIVKRSGGMQYVPAYDPVFTSPSATFGVSYMVDEAGVTIYNRGSFSVSVTYMVFNADPVQGRSSGGERVMYRGNDGVKDYIQIKRPGSSDSDIRPSDILLDTRFPTVHILQEGWLPAGDFTMSPTGEYMTLGRTRRIVPVSIPDDLIPFVKFTTVFPDHILPPYFSIGYSDTPGGNIVRGASRQSSLCLLDEAASELRFYLNPGSWTIIDNSGFIGWSPDPVGIRYYLFGLPKPD